MFFRTLIMTLLAAIMFSATAYAKKPGRIIDRLDRDDDGQVSLAEFQDREGGLIRRMDEDGDGAVTLDEIDTHLAERMAERQAEMQARHEQMQARLKEHFAKADENQDGFVTSDEARLAAFNRMDENGDGYITKEEFRAAHKHRRHGKRDHRQARDGGY